MNRLRLLPLLLTLMFCGISSQVIGQRLLYLGSGLNLSYTAPDSLNYITERFNESRGALSKRLLKFHFPVGVAFSGGAVLHQWQIDLSWVGRTQTNRAIGPTSSAVEQLHLKFKMNSFNFGIGRKIAGFPNGMLMAGLSTDIVTVRTLARTGDQNFIREIPYSLLTSNMTGANSVYLQLMLGELKETGVLMMIRPYYQVHWSRTDFLNTNAGINPLTWLGDPQSLPSRGNNFGITGMMVIYFSDL